MYLDIHSHILPKVDDGAKDFKESLKLLKEMKDNGITDVIATSHFYPMAMSFDDYIKKTKEIFEKLKSITEDKDLPFIYYGCEMLYYKGISNAEVLNQICLNNSNFLLLELTDFDIKRSLFEDILALKERGIIPIIAHIERYSGAKKFNEFLKFLKENEIPVQFNAETILKFFGRIAIKRVLKKDLFFVIATDSHSLDKRPPVLKEALLTFEKKFGESFAEKARKNNKKLYELIIGENIEK